MASLSDYTPEQLANLASDPVTLDNLLDDLGVGNKKREFFAQFDESEITDILASFEQKISSLGSAAKSKLANLRTEFSNTVKAGKQVEGKSGIASGNPMKMVSSLLGNMGQVGTSLTQDRKGLDLEKGLDMKSAYQTYADQFYSMYGAVKDA
jgi:hypothetical protein